MHGHVMTRRMETTQRPIVQPTVSPRCMLITGAAKRVGAAIAEHFAAQGWNLVLHYHQSATAAQALAERLQRDHGITVQLVQADLSDSAVLGDFWRALPACDAFVHSAATFERDTLASMQPAVLQQQMQVNFTTPLLLAQGFMQQLPEHAGAGNIILLGDGVMGWSISPEFFSYSISKQAWLGALDVLAAACAPRAKVNLLALAPTIPGVMDGPDTFDRLAARAPLQRTGQPDEVCAAIDYLLHAPGVTGQVLSLAAGAHLQSYRQGA
ncbi:MAG: hypothetical protein DI582_00125 [Azospirillum brasilense]|nr:MAG: hypothetical protein DI582_00125 [Azospirillum brasilense]